MTAAPKLDLLRVTYHLIKLACVKVKLETYTERESKREKKERLGKKKKIERTIKREWDEKAEKEACINCVPLSGWGDLQTISLPRWKLLQGYISLPEMIRP